VALRVRDRREVDHGVRAGGLDQLFRLTVVGQVCRLEIDVLAGSGRRSQVDADDLVAGVSEVIDGPAADAAATARDEDGWWPCEGIGERPT